MYANLKELRGGDGMVQLLPFCKSVIHLVDGKLNENPGRPSVRKHCI